MKKIIMLCLLICYGYVFAHSNSNSNNNSKTIDMSNLKCGSFQIYNTTTVEEIRNNCTIIKEATIRRTNKLNLPKKYWHGQETLFEMHFTGSNQKEKLVRCDFLNKNPTATVIGCR